MLEIGHRADVPMLAAKQALAAGFWQDSGSRQILVYLQPSRGKQMLLANVA